jgi:hypothetical protein
MLIMYTPFPVILVENKLDFDFLENKRISLSVEYYCSTG